MAAKAIDYLHQAGNRAVLLSASAEAIAHFTQGLALLETLPDTALRAQREFDLLRSLIVPLTHTDSVASPEVESVLTRALELCQQIGEASQLFSVMVYLVVQRVLRGEPQAARETL